MFSCEQFAERLETHEAVEWATSGVWSRMSVIEEICRTHGKDAACATGRRRLWSEDWRCADV